MSDDQGKPRPPADDRTLLDPLNADELRALREARQKMQKPQAPSVGPTGVGPDSGQDIGDAPTRAMPALPQFESPGVSLDKISTLPAPAAKPAAAPQPSAASARMTVGAQQQPPSQPMSAQGATHPAAQPPSPAQPPPGQQQVGGFGENTLMWMAPPKAPAAAATTSPGSNTGDLGLGKSNVSPLRRFGPTAGIVGVALLFGAALFRFGGSGERGVIDLHTTPPRAEVKINGSVAPNATPMKLNLVPGPYEIEVSLEGYETVKFNVDVQGGKAPIRKELDLEPVSMPGLMTVSVAVQPIAANIHVDGKLYPVRKSVKIANLDPTAPHKIAIEAGGYVKIEQDIAKGQLKGVYNFILQPDEEMRRQQGGE